MNNDEIEPLRRARLISKNTREISTPHTCGSYTFQKRSYYWVVKGKVPLEVARQLYADPVGKTDIRVSGHGAGLNPDEHYGLEINLSQEELKTRSDRIFTEKGEKPPGGYNTDYVIQDILANGEIDKLFFDIYHIDSEIGLRVFADILRENGLIPSDTIS